MPKKEEKKKYIKEQKKNFSEFSCGLKQFLQIEIRKKKITL